MKLSTSLKSLTILGLTTLSLASTSSQAQTGNVHFGGNSNPWMNNASMQQASRIEVLQQRQTQLDRIQDAQMQHILKGMESGKLTSHEAAGLIREHIDIANLERSYLADGRLGPFELDNLEQRLNQAAKHIKWETKDREQAISMVRPGEASYLVGYGNKHERDNRHDEGRPANTGRR